MIRTLTPYAAYKGSGVPWLGKVPVHWEVKPVKRHYDIQLGKMLQTRPNSPDDIEVPYLKAQHIQWFSVRTSDAPRMWASPRDIQQFGITAGDLLVCEGGEGGRCGIVKEIPEGFIIQNALHRVRPRDHCRNDYLQYVMSVIATTGWFDALTNKATIAHFTREKFGALYIPIPSPDEQTAIVRFLDYMDRRIRRYIRAKQKLVKLLEEYKQTLIHQAVTGKIDVRTGQPYPAYKDSGVEWLGEVPEHWEVRRLKTVVDHINEQTSTKNDEDLYIALEHVESWTGRLLVPSGEAQFDSQVKRFRAGDVLFGKLRPYLAKVVRPKQSGVCVGEFFVLRARPVVAPHYLEVVLRSAPAIDFVNSSTYGAKMPRADWTFVGAMLFPLPPLPEQSAIVEYLDAQTTKIDAAIAAARREIELLREYRTRLISDVVTGKVDVREVAARLPEEPAEEEAELEDTEETAEGEAADNEAAAETFSEEEVEP
ncbi:hypothetical protein E308F_19790 [Moorella sp. E308F]|uniref:restriction endonuclease subunit S n=1 Tax=Moorella sp. E308F TaxID=2572682 RepID=UPI0010FFC4FE|nr:restriction endonuclease subunit S [Moorella sp. E308F]GEA15735.1 hypothetical protein E308F_19790 [Moorella sp. E308F]